MLVSILAARHAALKELKLRYPFIEEGVLLSRLVAYCSKIVSTVHLYVPSRVTMHDKILVTFDEACDNLSRKQAMLT